MPAVVGVFPGRKETETAIDQLVALGVSQDALGVVWRERAVPQHEVVEAEVYVDHFDSPGVEAKKGAIGGAAGGGAAGVGGVILATGGVALATPIGGLLTAGTLAAVAMAAAAGAVGGSIAGGLVGALLGLTDHDATKVKTRETHYRDVIERDGFVLTVDSTDDDVDRVSNALSRVGAAEISVLRGDGGQLRTVTHPQESDSS